MGNQKTYTTTPTTLWAAKEARATTPTTTRPEGTRLRDRDHLAVAVAAATVHLWRQHVTNSSLRRRVGRQLGLFTRLLSEQRKQRKRMQRWVRRMVKSSSSCLLSRSTPRPA